MTGTEERFRCPYQVSESVDMMTCPRGFPGCACADDVMMEDGPGWHEWWRVNPDGWPGS